MRILFIITARGGSKGIPHKNIIRLGGLPLIAYKILAAKQCRFDHRIIVSTDDYDIAKIALKYGAEVPFIRPRHLATDTSDSIDVVMHTVEWVEENDQNSYDLICLLEPSSPFLPGEYLNEAIELMIEKGADTMLGVKRAITNRVFINELDKDGGMSYFYREIIKLVSTRRQDQKDEYVLNGCLYIAKYSYFKRCKTFHAIYSVPYIMPWWLSLEIDTKDDLDYAEYLIKNGRIDITLWKV